MARFLLYAIPVVVMLYALIDALQTPRGLERLLPKWLWIVVIVLVPVLGAVAWLIWGRAPRSAYAAPVDPPGGRRLGRRRGPAAPDDDPTFLRQPRRRGLAAQDARASRGPGARRHPGLRRALTRVRRRWGGVRRRAADPRRRTPTTTTAADP